MEEIKIENDIGLKVYVNGKIYIKEIPPEELETLVVALEIEISEYYDKTNDKNNLLLTGIQKYGKINLQDMEEKKG